MSADLGGATGHMSSPGPMPSQPSAPVAGDDRSEGTPPQSIRRAVAADFATASVTRRLALVAVVVWLAYEWGPGNESVTPWLLVNVIGHSSGPVVIPVTALVGFVFTAVQQLASGYTALAGFSMFDRTARAAWTQLRGGASTAPGEWASLSWPGRCAMVFALGTTAVALVQIMTTGDVGVRRHSAVVRQSALLCGVLVGGIGALVATIAHIGRDVDSLSGATDWTLRILGNPLFWLTVFVLPAILRLLVRRESRGDPSRLRQR